MIAKIRAAFTQLSRQITARYCFNLHQNYTSCSRALRTTQIMSSSETLRSLYPISEPFDSGHLEVDEIHKVYYEQCGKPDGNPVVFMLVSKV